MNPSDANAFESLAKSSSTPAPVSPAAASWQPREPAMKADFPVAARSADFGGDRVYAVSRPESTDTEVRTVKIDFGSIFWPMLSAQIIFMILCSILYLLSR